MLSKSVQCDFWKDFISLNKQLHFFKNVKFTEVELCDDPSLKAVTTTEPGAQTQTQQRRSLAPVMSPRMIQNEDIYIFSFWF